MPARKQPQDHLAPKDDRIEAVMETKPTALDDQFTVEDGDILAFTSKRGPVLRLSLDPEVGALDEMMRLDQTSLASSDDIHSLIELMVGLAGDDARRISVKELQPVFERYAWELAIAMSGVTLPESGGSGTD